MILSERIAKGLALTLMGWLGRMLASQLGLAGVVIVADTEGSRPNFLHSPKQDAKLVVIGLQHHHWQG
jgi:hypothetical protein